MTTAPPDDLAPVIPELEDAVAAYVREQGLAGAAVGLVVDDRLAWFHGVGQADRSTGRGMDARTALRIGSISKTFTAVIVMRLRDAGKLRLDDPVVRYVPELAHAVNPYGPVEELTIRRMLRHTSGLDAQLEVPDPEAAERWRLLSTATALAFPERIRVVDPPGSTWRYSGIAYRLLGVVIERLCGRPFWEVLDADILRPLGMESTGPTPAGEATARCAIGYERQEGSDGLALAPVMDSGWFIASGELWSTVEDLARWATAQFVPYGLATTGPEILAPSSMREMHRQTVPTDDPLAPSWGLGWAGMRAGDRETVGHTGGIPGFVSGLDLCLRERVGAISLFNTPPALGPSLNATLLEIALPHLR